MLLPDVGVSDACVRFARELVAERTPRAVVGPSALPHVSLLHVETNADPGELWKEAEASLPPAVRIDVLALGLLRYDTPYNAPAADPATMAWLIVPCSAALRDAEQKALALPSVRRAEVTTANGDLFQPHLTLAIWDGESPPCAATLPKPLFSPVEARLALGEIGPNGTYRRSLFTA